MSKNVFQPFNDDVEESGGYLYASGDRRSAQYANRRFSDMIIHSLDFTGKRVVDVGCGDGTYTHVLRQETQAAAILGIDPAQKAIERATALYGNQRNDLSFLQGFSSDLVDRGEHFDMAIYRGVIHHVGDAAAEIATALALADMVLFLEPNGWNPILKVLERFSAYHRQHEEQSFLLSRYRGWIQEAKGEVTHACYFGLVPMFCPDWLVPVGSLLEPIIERMPILRQLCCGQIVVVASISPDKKGRGLK